MKTIKREFHGDEVPLDFHEYVDCTFKDCVLVFHGYTPPDFTNCVFDGCSVRYEGPAGMGLNWIAAMKNHEDSTNVAIADALLRAANLPT